MKVKTNKLTEKTLDWAVALVKGEAVYLRHDFLKARFEHLVKTGGAATRASLDWHFAVQANDPMIGAVETGKTKDLPRYSTDWSQGGPLIDSEGLDLYCNVPTDPTQKDEAWRGGWRAKYHRCGYGSDISFGKTALIAAMRCLVTSHLGDEVDIPDELVNPKP